MILNSPRTRLQRRLVVLLVTLAALVATATPGSATVLIFDGSTFPSEPDPGVGDPLEGAKVDQGYGDRVTGSPDLYGNFLEGAGWTPNVVAEYGPIVGTDWPVMWRFDFGDLVNVIYMPEITTNTLTVTLIADPGYNVQLYGFDLGGWPDSDYTINSVTVTQMAGVEDEFFRQDDVLVYGASDPFHTSFGFEPLQGQILRITIDSSNLGAASENIGIDNISFGQILVPEPSTFALATLGILGVMAYARRKDTVLGRDLSKSQGLTAPDGPR